MTASTELFDEVCWRVSVPGEVGHWMWVTNKPPSTVRKPLVASYYPTHAPQYWQYRLTSRPSGVRVTRD